MVQGVRACNRYIGMCFCRFCLGSFHAISKVGSLGTLIGLASGYAMSGFIIGNDGTVCQQLEANFKWLFVAQGFDALKLGLICSWFIFPFSFFFFFFF